MNELSNIIITLKYINALNDILFDVIQLLIEFLQFTSA